MSHYVVVNRFPLSIYAGTFASIVFQAPVEIDLTGKTLVMKLRKNVDAPQVVQEYSTVNQLIQVSGQQFAISFLPEHTAVKPGTYVADIRVYTTPGVDDIIIGEGDITVKQSPSR